MLRSATGETMRVHLEIGFGSGDSFFTTNEVEFRIDKPELDGGTDGGADASDAGLQGDAGAKT